MSDHLPAVAGVDRAQVLRYLNLDPQDVATHALLLICDRYGLDPLMKHVVLIQGRPYITRDGYLHVAHTSGQLDGIEVVEEGESNTHWTAKVAVFRKDMGRPFAYTGRYPKSGTQKVYGPEMAIKTAEVMALRRAFDVTGVGAADEQWDQGAEVEVPSVAMATPEDIAAIKALTKRLTDEQRAEVIHEQARTIYGVMLTAADRQIVATAEQAADIIDRLKKIVPAEAPSEPDPEGPATPEQIARITELMERLKPEDYDELVSGDKESIAGIFVWRDGEPVAQHREAEMVIGVMEGCIEGAAT